MIDYKSLKRVQSGCQGCKTETNSLPMLTLGSVLFWLLKTGFCAIGLGVTCGRGRGFRRKTATADRTLEGEERYKEGRELFNQPVGGTHEH